MASIFCLECPVQAKRKAADGLAEVAAGKAQLLQRQLELIREEQSVVARDVADLQFQIEVRSLGERIAALQNKLDAVSTLQVGHRTRGNVEAGAMSK